MTKKKKGHEIIIKKPQETVMAVTCSFFFSSDSLSGNEQKMLRERLTHKHRVTGREKITGFV